VLTAPNRSDVMKTMAAASELVKTGEVGAAAKQWMAEREVRGRTGLQAIIWPQCKRSRKHKNK